MLRKRSRPFQRDQRKAHIIMHDYSPPESSCYDGLVQKGRSSSLFSLPGLFVGFTTKGLSDCYDSAKSPTSPLDHKLFSNPSMRSPRSWDNKRVGLGLVDSLSEEETMVCGSVLGSKNILFGSQMRINIPNPKTHLTGFRDGSSIAAPKSLPKDYGISSLTRAKMGLGFKGAELVCGELGKNRSFSADLGESLIPPTQQFYENPKANSENFPSSLKNTLLDSPPPAKGSYSFENFSGSLPISIVEIEQSEDYTCIISHGPNPKTTHIFGDCILESHKIESPDSKNKERKEGAGSSSWVVNFPVDYTPAPPDDDFLSFCFSCKKKLEGNDIYIYRGEKAFCSSNCRDQEILIEEEAEKQSTSSEDSPGSFFHEDIFMSGMVTAT
ncbi:uncharacterized protein LOC109716663 [Ananas comosus]|uniref:Uncharacterized protein LOC109716663 n=1 Tax=Ananas comosus TaxID=4615 RepID=A0A6P5FWA1_ANACO|nr:uncharacterized protein LOC109716663 [Ananas comosus]XP_020097791.1 uncharacterized protein LOC109716663 [Ananas comosus]XP_020097792.1 uncharacterized protein LOC109716663 [Ananas comosus]XP_020097793.1 uncharacterized protein LOC109716663 [Ananas comosus]